jgi:hypothetical protein
VLMAVDLLKQQGKRIDRVALRPLFYGQCFITAPFALVVSIGGLLLEFQKTPQVIAGLVVFLLAVCWYTAVEVMWFSSTLNVTKFVPRGMFWLSFSWPTFSWFWLLLESTTPPSTRHRRSTQWGATLWTTGKPDGGWSTSERCRASLCREAA